MIPQIPDKQLANGFHMPAFGIGTWQMGGKWDRDPDNDDAADISAIRAAIALGVTCIDTADLYAHGHTEALVAEAIRGSERSSLFMISKVRDSHMAYDDVLRACEATLRRLGVTYLDLYILHVRNPRVPLEQTVRALDRLADEGLVRSIGVANFSTDSLREAQRCARHPIVYNQVHYNLQFREPERSGLLAYCQTHDVLLAGWRPLQKGALVRNIPPLVQEMCEKYAKTPAQIAINWLVSQRNVVTVAKTSAVPHLTDNLGGLGWQMEEADVERLRREYPDQKTVSNSMPLG
jgi:diketogulonate reductase-like aldo/keto reductase